MAEPRGPIRILVVDPLEGVASSEQSPSGVTVVQASEIDGALQILRRGAVDGVVIALELGADDVATLVGEIERALPGVQVAGIVSAPGDEQVALASQMAMVGLLQRPVDPKTVRRMFERCAPALGFVGSCHGLPTAQLVSLLCEAGADGVLHLRRPATSRRSEERGSVFLEGGQPVHATCGSGRGAPAVYAMLGWVDTEATWLGGRPVTPRTIVGQWQGLVARARPMVLPAPADAHERAVALAYPAVVSTLSGLAQTPDVLATFLLRHGQVVTGRCGPGLDEAATARTVARLANVALDAEALRLPGPTATQIQASIGTVRLVIGRVGPRALGLQVAVVVKQASAVCKSLRRTLRKIDRCLERADTTGARQAA